MNPSINPFAGKPIRSLQESLRRIAQTDPAIPAVIPDGVFGEQTRRAVLAFQNQRGLPPTGRVDLETWERIAAEHTQIAKREAPPHRAGLYPAAGFQVRQGERNVHLFSITGVLAGLAARFPALGRVEMGDVYTAATEAVVRNLQLAFGMEADGMITKQFWDQSVGLYEAAVASLSFESAAAGAPEEGGGMGM